MISKGFLETLFRGAGIQRWNDHIRPIELTELDKQAHKAIIAYIIGKTEEFKGVYPIDWSLLVEGSIFEYLQRIVLTDIKPPVFNWIYERAAGEICEIVFIELYDKVITVGEDFKTRFEKYLWEEEYAKHEKSILRAAHWLATEWEFDKVIYGLNEKIGDIEKTRKNISDEITKHKRFLKDNKIRAGEDIYNFVDLCGQLRFQQRWAQTPRIPKTSVLGHMFLVGILAYVFSLQIPRLCNKLKVNNFYAGIFHDVPEAMTRDIVEPVKRYRAIRELVKQYEDEEIKKTVFRWLPENWRYDFFHLLPEECVCERAGKMGDFFSKIRYASNPKVSGLIQHEAVINEFNLDNCDPVCGRLVKLCDGLAGCMEAAVSIESGIKTSILIEGRDNYYMSNASEKLGPLVFLHYFDYFRTSGY